jgi:hypothetical protein
MELVLGFCKYFHNALPQKAKGSTYLLSVNKPEKFKSHNTVFAQLSEIFALLGCYAG